MYVSVSESFHSCAEDEVLKSLLRLKRCRRRHQKSNVLPMLISWDMFFKNCDLLMTPKPNCCQSLKKTPPKLVRLKGSCWFGGKSSIKLDSSSGSKPIRFNSRRGYRLVESFVMSFRCTRRFDLPSKYSKLTWIKDCFCILNYSSSRRSVSQEVACFHVPTLPQGISQSCCCRSCQNGNGRTSIPTRHAKKNKKCTTCVCVCGHSITNCFHILALVTYHFTSSRGPSLLSLVDGQRRGQWQEL